MNSYLVRHLATIRGALLATVVLGLLTTAAVVVQMALLSVIVRDIFLQRMSFTSAWNLLVVLLGISVLRAILTGARETVVARAAVRVKSTLRAEAYAHLLGLGPAYCHGERTGELVTTVVEGIERLDAYVSRYLPQVWLSVLVPLAIAAVVAPADLTSAVLLLVTGPIIPLLMILVGKYAESQIQREWEGLSRMSAHFLDVVQGLSTLLLFGRAEAESDRIARISERYRERALKALRVAFLSGMILDFMTASAIGVLAVVLGVRLLDGNIAFDRAFFVLLLAPEFYRPLRDLGAQRHAGLEGKAALGRIAEILETPLLVPTELAPFSPRTSATEAHRSPEAPGLAGPLTLELREVAFTYSGSDRPALAGVSLTLPAGTRTALVGRSGAGKSTLINLVLRFLDTQNGSITVNDLPLDELPVDVWRRYIALVPQRPYLFAGSVRDNLLLARPAATDAEMLRAMELAGVSEFVSQLPRGYDTPIGERGVRLSAGQAQRLALSRAFLKDASLLILDEPTSSLDPESEAMIREATRALARERTVLVVAHRLNTAMSADQIVVLDEGRVVETGTHAALLRRGAAYAQLVGAASVRAVEA